MQESLENNCGTAYRTLSQEMGSVPVGRGAKKKKMKETPSRDDCDYFLG